MNDTIKKLLPHLAAYLILLAVSFIYFSPAVFEGKVLQQSDNIQARGMQTEMKKVYEETGEPVLWTNAAFAGLPGYQIIFFSQSALKYPYRLMLLGSPFDAPKTSRPHTSTLLLMVGVYLMLVVFKIDWRIALLGAIGFGLSTNFIDLQLAGHSTKVVALAMMGPSLAGIWLAFRGKYVLGGAMTALFLGLQVYANHLQITYYFMIIVGILGIIELVQAIQNKTLPHFLQAAGVLILAAGLAFGSSASKLWTTYEYSQESIRGQSELTQKAAGASGSTAAEGGLSKDYAFNWSYGIGETMTLLIPGYAGFSSGGNFVSDRSSETYDALRRLNNPELANQLVAKTGHYWGAQPFTGAPVYFGAVIVFLFFLGAFTSKHPLKWWILIGVVLTIMMGWGENFKALNYFLFDTVPLYNKFRAVTMVFGLTCFLTILMGALGLQAFFGTDHSDQEKRRGLILGGAITGGLILLTLLLSFTMDFGTANAQLPDALAEALRNDRAGLLQADAVRSLVFVGLAFGILWFYLRKTLTANIAVIALAVLTLVDLWGVDRRVVGTDDFTEARNVDNFVQASQIDQQISADPDPYFRVADFRQNPWSSALTSYHHKSMGGYHAAKLMRFQELLERYLSDPNANRHIYGMLNTKYFIFSEDQASPVPEAAGNAWFVESYNTVPDGDAEIAALANLKPKTEAVLQQSYAEELGNFNLQFDSTATIELISYHPDELVYRYSAQSDQLAMFSEVFYPEEKGWSLYLGEERIPILKANFILRAAKLPAGQNQELRMVFEPKSYYQGELIATASSWLTLLLLFGGLFLFFRNEPIGDANRLPESGQATPATKAKSPKKKGKK